MLRHFICGRKSGFEPMLAAKFQPVYTPNRHRAGAWNAESS